MKNLNGTIELDYFELLEFALNVVLANKEDSPDKAIEMTREFFVEKKIERNR